MAQRRLTSFIFQRSTLECAMPSNPSIKTFRGLNNVSDSLRLKLGWLAVADNVDITDTGALVSREGYSRTLAGTFTGAYSTKDRTRIYVVCAGALTAMVPRAASGVTLESGLDDARMHWAEINDRVFFNNGVDRGIILPDNTLLEWAWPVPGTPV